MTRARLLILCALFAVCAVVVGVSVHAATATYDFEADTLGQPPANTTVTSGTFAVANQTALGDSLKATAVTTPTTAGIMLDSFASTSDYSVTWKEAYESGGGRHGYVLRSQTGNSAFGTGIKQGYLFQVNHATANVTNAVRLYRLTSGATTQLVSTNLTAASPRWFRAVASGSNLALYYSDNGTTYTQIIATTSDTMYGSGNTQYIAGFGQGVDDMYVDDIVQNYDAGANGITLTSPTDYRVFQRNGSDEADIDITGTYTGTPTAIEASWNGGAYTTIDSSLSGGSFSGTLTNQDAGQGTLTVRFTNDTAVTDTSAYVGVGDIFVIAGQSNASGRGTNNQTYTHGSLKASLFGNDDTWKELTDPTDSNTGQVDSVSSDSGSAAGSVWPLLATHFLAAEGVPVAFIPTAKGGTSIDEWQYSLSASTLYGSMHRRITAVGGEVKAILFFQGETDAIDGMTQSAYLDYLYAFSNHAYADFGVKTVVGQIGNQNVTAANIDAIRLAQIESWDNGTTTLPGPSTADVNLADESGDNLHFKSNGDLDTFAERWWAALDKNYYGGADGRGPRFSSAEENGARTAVTVFFSDDSLPLLPSSGMTGFVVKDNGVAVAPVSTTTFSTNGIRIGLGSPLTGTVTVSFGSGTTLSGKTVPTDSSTFNLPAEIFIDESVSAGTPPIVTNGSPTGTLASGTTGATLSVTTNENAHCKYGTTAGTTYALLPNVFDTTGTTTPRTTHTSALTGLTDGTSYSYVVRCADVMGSATTTDLAISFSVASPAPTPDPDEEEEDENRPPSRRRSIAPGVGTVPAPVVIPPTSTPTGAPTQTLAFGSVGDSVRALQIALIAKGYLAEGSVSGYFGPLTQSALIAYQTAQGIVPAVGVFGPVTQAALLGETVPAPASSGTFTRSLGVGSDGEDVRTLQKFLNTHGYAITVEGPGAPGNETTYYGELTRAALARFQAANGISPAEGFFGPLTRATINKTLGVE